MIEQESSSRNIQNQSNSIDMIKLKLKSSNYSITKQSYINEIYHFKLSWLNQIVEIDRTRKWFTKYSKSIKFDRYDSNYNWNHQKYNIKQ